MNDNQSTTGIQIHLELKSGIAFDLTTKTAGNDIDTLFAHLQKHFTDDVEDVRGVFRAFYALTVIARSIEAALRSTGEDDAVNTLKNLITENS